MEPLELTNGYLRLRETSEGYWLDRQDTYGIELSEDELRWLVTTAGPAVLPRRETVW